MADTKCKTCRRQGEKLFLKGERCFSAKCAMVRKPYAPGIHGPGARRRPPSEYGTQLSEKQKVRFLYGVSESQFRGYVEDTLSKKGVDVIAALLQTLESRLDNVVFRMGFAVSRSVAHQLISHGHIMVNGKKVFVGSYQTRLNQKVAVAPSASDTNVLRDLDITLKKHQAPSWISLEPEKREGTIISLPKVEDVVRLYNVKSIIEYYSR